MYVSYLVFFVKYSFQPSSCLMASRSSQQLLNTIFLTSVFYEPFKGGYERVSFAIQNQTIYRYITEREGEVEMHHHHHHITSDIHIIVFHHKWNFILIFYLWFYVLFCFFHKYFFSFVFLRCTVDT